MMKIKRENHSNIVLTASKKKALLKKIESLNGPESLLITPFFNSCCALNFDTAFNESRYTGFEISVPEDSNILIIGGIVTHKTLPLLKKTYEKMLKPCWVITIDSCTCLEQNYSSYNTIQKINEYITIDLYLSGTRLTPEYLFEELQKLVGVKILSEGANESE